MNFKGAKIIHFSFLIICDQNKVYITGGFPVVIDETNFAERSPCRIPVKKETGGIIFNQPVFLKSIRAGDYGFPLVVHATHTQGVFYFVLCATRNFIIKRAKFLLPIAHGFFTKISGKMPKHLR